MGRHCVLDHRDGGLDLLGELSWPNTLFGLWQNLAISSLW
jgi:hypothetical protein